MTEVVDASPRGLAALPTWARIGLIALAAVLVALLAIVAIRLATRVPPIPHGTTDVADLRPGSCLAEDGADLEQYTVVPCDRDHAQQVFATADLDLQPTVYALVESALAQFGDQVCSRYLEYRVFLHPELVTSAFTASAIAVPDPDEYAAGDTEALCVLRAVDGGAFTGDAYRAMP